MDEREITSNLLNQIPQETLTKLEPFKGRLDEVFRQQNDLAHLRNHILDCIFLFRNYDSEASQYKRQATINYWNDIAPKDYGEGIELLDLPTFDKVERGLRLHDTGRAFVQMGILKPEEHHFGSLFIASIVDGDPLVCEACLHHIDDALPKKTSIVTQWVQSIDRLSGSGYVGLTRYAFSQGFNHQYFSGKNIEEKTLDYSLMSTDQHGNANESIAKEFFWKDVYPFFQQQGDLGLIYLATYSKIVADRIVGRNYIGRRDLNGFEREVLKMDRNSRKVSPIISLLDRHFDFKLKNTLDVLVKARRDFLKEQYVLTLGEQIAYRYHGEHRGI